MVEKSEAERGVAANAVKPSFCSFSNLTDGVGAQIGKVAFRKYETTAFKTPTGKVELYSTTLAAAGYPPLHVYLEPAHSPVSTPEVSRHYPLILTNAKRTTYLHS